MLSYKLETGLGFFVVETLIERNDWRKVLTTMVEVDRLAALMAVSIDLQDMLEGLSEDEIDAVTEFFESLL